MEQLEVLTENTESFKSAEVIATVTVLLTVTEDVTGNITVRRLLLHRLCIIYYYFS